MLTRIGAPGLLLLLMLLVALAACQDSPPAQTIEPSLESVQASSPTPTTEPPQESARDSSPAPATGPAPEYLTENIPPCTPIEGSTVDPCTPDFQVDAGGGGMGSGVGSDIFDNPPRTIRSFLDGNGFGHEAHAVIRATYIPGTIRCRWGVPFRPLAARESGLFDNSLLIECFSDVRVNEYIVGSGPSQLTLMIYFFQYFRGEYAGMAAEAGVTENVIMSAFAAIDELRLQGGAAHSGGGVGGNEAVLFIGPSHNHGTEAWAVISTWDVQRIEDDEGNETVVIVHPYRDVWRDAVPEDYQTLRSTTLEMTPAAFKQAATAASAARNIEYGGRIRPADFDRKKPGTTLPMIETDANRLKQFLTSAGAYDHPAGPPRQPPAAYVCANGMAVDAAVSKQALIRECSALLAGKDTLRGTTSLNWSKTSAITGWDGITTNTDTTSITKVELPRKGLNGSIPAELGVLYSLPHLDLSNNSLTGEIPVTFHDIRGLESIKLSGNSLTGCIPINLKNVEDHDLDSLQLPDCAAE